MFLNGFIFVVDFLVIVKRKTYYSQPKNSDTRRNIGFYLINVCRNLNGIRFDTFSPLQLRSNFYNTTTTPADYIET